MRPRQTGLAVELGIAEADLGGPAGLEGWLADASDLARRRDNWRVHDMVYVALAERTGELLVTADQELRSRLAHLSFVALVSDA